LKALSVVTHYCLIQSSRRQVFFFIAANEEQENDAPRSILIMIFEICSAVQFRNFFISIKCKFLACFVLFFIERLKHVPYLTRLQFWRQVFDGDHFLSSERLNYIYTWANR
jgi:hypothetical protein